jgi:hypothetical protein
MAVSTGYLLCGVQLVAILQTQLENLFKAKKVRSPYVAAV